ncbi:hypothetical protein [Bosea rubneri]|uniref:Uncharacterized protein n=1 Tax=Bosea rubneri TaxID=3075434 RepID=A0ABU3SDV9_9HYPH|nr:hypothetical protein [Bosea sp. ZW T0_25]MDU0342982.1 hypothetical protein [Bosea sp. ZW T0_25]
MSYNYATGGLPGGTMFGPKGTTTLDSFEYRLILAALERESRYLQAESDRHRDAYDPPAWAEATSKGRLVAMLRRRLEREMDELPARTVEERQWEQNLLLRWAGRIPRSKANAEAHRANVTRRREAAEARRAAYWERKARAHPEI